MGYWSVLTPLDAWSIGSAYSAWSRIRVTGPVYPHPITCLRSHLYEFSASKYPISWSWSCCFKTVDTFDPILPPSLCYCSIRIWHDFNFNCCINGLACFANRDCCVTGLACLANHDCCVTGLHTVARPGKHLIVT